MKFTLMYLSFLIAYAVILVCLTKKQMKIARAIFLAIGIGVGFSSALLIYAQHAVDVPWANVDTTTIRLFVVYMLGITTIVFDIITLTIVVATIILSIFVFKKIINFLKGKCLDLHSKPAPKSVLCLQAKAPSRRIFLLFCRWLN